MKKPLPGMRTGVALWVVAVGVVGAAAAEAAEDCTARPALYRTALAVELPDEHNTPDGMTLAPDGHILLACPNFNTNAKDNEQPVWIMQITPQDKLQPWFPLPVHPQTEKVCPLGIAFGADGHLYVADCQALGGNPHRVSRLLRVVVQDGKPVRCEVVVEGFVMANGVACHGDSVYVTETQFVPEPGPGPLASGVLRFRLTALNADRPLRLQPDGRDPHVVARLTTKNPAWRVGANGIGFAPDGTMYVCNFGDAELIAVRFDAQGRVASQQVLAAGGPMKSTDGLKVDPQTGVVYIADFVGNAVHAVCPRTGRVTVLAQNGPSDGRSGELDKCSEVCLRGRRLYVANIDLPLDGNTFDKPYSVSVIELSAP